MELDSANIEIDGSSGSSPISVVKHAYRLYQQELSSGDSYNSIFCVFDRDSHESFNEAVARVDEINKELVAKGLDDQTKFKAIISIPSFEYWLLIHYLPTTKPYAQTPTKSVGDLVVDDLKQYLPNYQKTQKGLFILSLEEGTLEGALANSKRIYESEKRSLGSVNSRTNVHELILYLQQLKG